MSQSAPEVPVKSKVVKIAKGAGIAAGGAAIAYLVGVDWDSFGPIVAAIAAIAINAARQFLPLAAPVK
jgi:hypothetical protein